MSEVSDETLKTQAVTLEQWQAASNAERAAMFPLAQQSDEATNQMLQRCGQFAKENPSLALTLVYLAMSLMGLLFQVSLLSKFGLNVLPYLEISDFLLSALTHPEVVALLAFMLVVLVGLFSFERWCRRKILRYAISTEISFQRWWVPQPLLWMPLMFMSYLIMAAWSNGHKLAKNIRTGEGSKLEVLLVYPIQQNNDQKVLKLQSAQLISRTASYLFIYHDNKVKVLPHANVAALLPEVVPEEAAKAATPATAQKESGNVADKSPEKSSAQKLDSSSDRAVVQPTEPKLADAKAQPASTASQPAKQQ